MPSTIVRLSDTMESRASWQPRGTENVGRARRPCAARCRSGLCNAFAESRTQKLAPLVSLSVEPSSLYFHDVAIGRTYVKSVKVLNHLRHAVSVEVTCTLPALFRCRPQSFRIAAHGFQRIEILLTVQDASSAEFSSARGLRETTASNAQECCSGVFTLRGAFGVQRFAAYFTLCSEFAQKASDVYDVSSLSSNRSSEQRAQSPGSISSCSRRFDAQTALVTNRCSNKFSGALTQAESCALPERRSLVEAPPPKPFLPICTRGSVYLRGLPPMRDGRARRLKMNSTTNALNRCHSVSPQRLLCNRVRLRACGDCGPSGMQEAEWNMAQERPTGMAAKILADVRSELEEAVKQAEKAERREQKLRAALDGADCQQGQVRGVRHEYSPLLTPAPQEAELKALVEQLEIENRSLSRIIQEMRTTVARKCQQIGQLTDEISRQSQELQKIQLENFTLRQRAQRSLQELCEAGGCRSTAASLRCATLRRPPDANDNEIMGASTARLAEENRCLRMMAHEKAQLVQREAELSSLRNVGSTNDTFSVSDRQVISKLNSRLKETLLKLQQAEQKADDIQAQYESKIYAIEQSGRRLPLHVDAEAQTAASLSTLYPFRQFGELQRQAASALSQDVHQRFAKLEQEKSDKTVEFTRLLDAKNAHIGQLSADMAGAIEQHATERRNLLGRLAALEMQLRTQTEKLDNMTVSLAGSNAAKEEALKIRDQDMERHERFRLSIQHKVRGLEQQLQVKSEQLKETIQSLDVLQRFVRAASLDLPHSAASTQASPAKTGMATPVLKIPEEFNVVSAPPNHMKPSSVSDVSCRTNISQGYETRQRASEHDSRADDIGCLSEGHPEILPLSERVCSLTAAFLMQSHALGLAEARAYDLQKECRELQARVYQSIARNETEESRSHQLVNETFMRDRMRVLERTAEQLRNENHLSLQKIKQLELGEARLQDECKLLREERQTWKRRLDAVHQDHIDRAERERKEHEHLLETLKHSFERLHFSPPYDDDIAQQWRIGGSSDYEQLPMPAFDTASGKRGHDEQSTRANLSGSCHRLIAAIQELTNVITVVTNKISMANASGAVLDKAACSHSSRNVAFSFSSDLRLDLPNPVAHVEVAPSPNDAAYGSPLGRTKVRTCAGSCAESFTEDSREPKGVDTEVLAGPLIQQLCELFLAVGRRFVTAERRASFSQLLGSLCYKQWQLQNAREAASIRDRNVLRQQVQALQMQVRADEASQDRMVARLCGLYQQRCRDLEDQREAAVRDLRFHEAKCSQLTLQLEKGKEHMAALQRRLSFLQASAKERELLAEATAEEKAMSRLQSYKKEITESLLSQAGIATSGADGVYPTGHSYPGKDLSDQLAQERRDRAALHLALKEAQRRHALSENRLEQAKKQVTVVAELLRHVSKEHAVIVDGELVESPAEGYRGASLSADEPKVFWGLRPPSVPEQAATDILGVAPVAQLRSEIATLREVVHQREMDNERQEVALSHSRLEANMLRQRNEALNDEIRASLTQLDEARHSLEESAILRQRLEDVELWANRMNETHQAEINTLKQAQEFHLQRAVAENTEKTKEQLREAAEANRQLKEQNLGLQGEIKMLNFKVQRFRESTMRHLSLQTHFKSTIEEWLRGVDFGSDGSNDTRTSHPQPPRRGAPNVASKEISGKQKRGVNPMVGSRRQAPSDPVPYQVMRPGYVPLDAVRSVLETLIQVCVQLGAAEQNTLEQRIADEPDTVLSASPTSLLLEPLSRPGPSMALDSQAILQGQRLVILCLYSKLVERLPELRNNLPAPMKATSDPFPLTTAFPRFSCTSPSRLVTTLDIPALLGTTENAGGCSRCSSMDLAWRAKCRLPLERGSQQTEVELGARRLQSLLQLCLQNIVVARCAQEIITEHITALQKKPDCHADPALPLSQNSGETVGGIQGQLRLSTRFRSTESPVAAGQGANSLFYLSNALPLLCLLHHAAGEAIPTLEKADSVAESLAVKLGIIFSIPVTVPEKRSPPQTSFWGLPTCGQSDTLLHPHSCSDHASATPLYRNIHRTFAFPTQKKGVFCQAASIKRLSHKHARPQIATLANRRGAWERTTDTKKDLTAAQLSMKCGRSPSKPYSAPILAPHCSTPGQLHSYCHLNLCTPPDVCFSPPRYFEEAPTAQSTAACSVESLEASSEASISECLSKRGCLQHTPARGFYPRSLSLSSPHTTCERCREFPCTLARMSPKPYRLACRRSFSMPPTVLSCSPARTSQSSCSLTAIGARESPLSPLTCRRKLDQSPGCPVAGELGSVVEPPTLQSFGCAACRQGKHRCIDRMPPSSQSASSKALLCRSQRVESLRGCSRPVQIRNENLSIVHLAPGRPEWLPPPLLPSVCPLSKTKHATDRCVLNQGSEGESTSPSQRATSRQGSANQQEDPAVKQKPQNTPKRTGAAAVEKVFEAKSERNILSAGRQEVRGGVAVTPEGKASARGPSCSPLHHLRQKQPTAKDFSKVCRPSSCTEAVRRNNPRVGPAPGTSGFSSPSCPLPRKPKLSGRPCGRSNSSVAWENGLCAGTPFSRSTN
ncbi:hypothetical protein TGPRC2_225280 [Toxoplasma gondii TgCatPRC2]|uniref:Uncharacterized protein n=1 Tax=Toxoplasma gondii TgCatPRC2 TaxID=1130821 RepID=A0A151HRJ5_TOXGO|nr:hypothetical protein TGPRC2_225280 [Toxoplasma gondii TgCatPRC2]